MKLTLEGRISRILQISCKIHFSTHKPSNCLPNWNKAYNYIVLLSYQHFYWLLTVLSEYPMQKLSCKVLQFHTDHFLDYMEPELEVPKNTEWQEQISHKSMPDTFWSLLRSLQGRIVNESSNISKYSPEGNLWWSLWSFWQNWCSMVKRISSAPLLHHNAINMLPRW